jgi:transmembrane 9 superfamily protein 2/4
MPVTFCFLNQQNQNVCTTGFPMGCYVTAEGKQKDACVLDHRYSQPNSYYIFNHVDLVIKYRDMRNDPNFLEHPIGGRIIAIYVIPRSIKHESKEKMDCSLAAPPLAIGANEDNFQIHYSYSIKFQVILQKNDEKIFF